MQDRVKSATGIDTVIKGGGKLYLKKWQGCSLKLLKKARKKHQIKITLCVLINNYSSLRPHGLLTQSP